MNSSIKTTTSHETDLDLEERIIGELFDNINVKGKSKASMKDLIDEFRSTITEYRKAYSLKESQVERIINDTCYKLSRDNKSMLATRIKRTYKLI